MTRSRLNPIRRVAPSRRLPRRPIEAMVFGLLCGLIVSPGMTFAGESVAGLRNAPEAFRAAAERAEPHLVTIETVGGISLGNVTGEQRDRRGLTNPGEGPTTGVILTAEGHIVTSTFNFLRKQRVVTVTLPDGSRHVAEPLGRDEMRKLVLLKIDVDRALEPATFIDPDQLRVGQWAITVGLGYGGEEAAISHGIISALDRAHGRAVQTDANISPANYGGPLLDIEGRFIGINTPLNPRAEGTAAGSAWYDSGIGFAIPLHDLDHLIDRMKEGETLTRGLVGFQPASEPLPEGGVRVQRVIDNTPAAGVLEAGDVIRAINEHPTDRLHAMQVALARYAAGDAVVIHFQRDGESAQARVVLADPAALDRARDDRESDQPTDSTDERKVESPSSESAPDAPPEADVEPNPDAPD